MKISVIMHRGEHCALGRHSVDHIASADFSLRGLLSRSFEQSLPKSDIDIRQLQSARVDRGTRHLLATLQQSEVSRNGSDVWLEVFRTIK